MTLPPTLIPTAVAVVLLTAVTWGVLGGVRIARPWEATLAIARGALQLAAISFILTGVISSPVWVGVALGVMFLIATGVAARRSGWTATGVLTGALAIAAGVLVAGTVVFLCGALEPTSRYVLAFGAIILGNAMSIATLTGRRFTQSVTDRWGEVEGWLALGAAPRRATRDLGRTAVREALIPSIDQAKTTGLVVLPGAFVGAIFGGLSPYEAARFQIVVLAAILCAGAITSVVIWMSHGSVRVRPPTV